MNNELSEKIRVLIADDSFFIRTYLGELLRGSSQIEVVGAASSGTEAVSLARKLLPDVITMDYHMPGKNGIEATTEIMLGAHPLPAIIILSAFLGEDGKKVRKTLEETGAHVIVKPSGEVSLDIEKIARDIVLKIEEVGLIQVKMRKAFAQIHHTNVSKSRKSGEGPLSGILVIGASTGGPPLIEHLLASLGELTGVAIVIVQHMSAYFSSLFSERLDRISPFYVHEAKSGNPLNPGEAFVVPGGTSLILSKVADSPSAYRMVVHPTNRDNDEVEIDETMASLARSYSGPMVGVILSGMGKDGTIGLKLIHTTGGLSLVQDPETATVGSMPQHALDGEEAEMINIEEMPSRIIEYFQVASLPRKA